VNKPVLSYEELERYRNAAETFLEKLIVAYQIDELLRHSKPKLRTNEAQKI